MFQPKQPQGAKVEENKLKGLKMNIIWRRFEKGLNRAAMVSLRATTVEDRDKIVGIEIRGAG